MTVQLERVIAPPEMPVLRWGDGLGERFHDFRRREPRVILLSRVASWSGVVVDPPSTSSCCSTKSTADERRRSHIVIQSRASKRQGEEFGMVRSLCSHGADSGTLLIG